MQLSMLRHVRLNEHGAALGIEAGCKPIEHDLERVALDARGIGVVGSERVPVGNEEEALVGILQLDPVGQRSHVIAKVQLAGGTHAAQYPAATSRWGRVSR